MGGMTRALVLALCCLLSMPESFAQEGTDPDAQARVYFDNGRYHFENGHYEEAINAWILAYELSGRHQLLYNIASAQERLGLWQEALNTLNTYRSYADPDEWTSLERRIKNLELRIDEQEEKQLTEDRTITFTPDFEAPDLSAEPPSKRAWALPLSIGGTAMVAAGVFLGVKARAVGEQAKVGCEEFESGWLCTDEVADQIRQQRGLAIGADLSMGLGALAAAGGVYFTVEGRF